MHTSFVFFTFTQVSITPKSIIALKKWLILPLIFLASCNKKSPFIIPDHLKNIEEMKIIEHVFHPDTTNVEREDIYTYDYRNRSLSETLSHKWVINSYNRNDSLIGTSFFTENQEHPITTTQFSYSPYRSSTKYLINENGDTIQIENEKYGPDGILTQEFQNLEREEPTYYSYNFSYKGGLVDSFAVVRFERNESILSSYDKRYYNQNGEFDSIILHEVEEKETRKWLFNRSNSGTVYVIDQQSKDTLGIEKYDGRKLTQSIKFGFYETTVSDFDKNGRLISEKVMAEDTVNHFYQYYRNRILEFIYTK